MAVLVEEDVRRLQVSIDDEAIVHVLETENNLQRENSALRSFKGGGGG